MMVLDASLATQGLSNSDDQEQDLHQSRSNQDWDATPGHLSRFALASAPGERDANLPGEPRLGLGDPQGPPPGEGEAGDACSALAGHLDSNHAKGNEGSTPIKLGHQTAESQRSLPDSDHVPAPE